MASWRLLSVCGSWSLLLLCAPICCSALLLLALLSVWLLVRLSALRRCWLWPSGLPRGAPGSGLLRWLLPLLLCPGSPWLLPLSVPLLLVLLSFPRPGAPGSLPLALAPCVPRARVCRPAARLCGWSVGLLMVLPWLQILQLLRLRR